MRRLLAFLACLVFAVPFCSSVAYLLAAKGPLWIHVNSEGGFAPKRVSVDIHVEPTDEDRMIWLTVYEDELIATSTEIQLHNGAQSQRTHHWPWRAMWPGEYTIVARLGHGSTVRATATERVLVP